MGGCQNFGPFLDPSYNTAPSISGYPKWNHNFDNHPYRMNDIGGGGLAVRNPGYIGAYIGIMKMK